MFNSYQLKGFIWTHLKTSFIMCGLRITRSSSVKSPPGFMSICNNINPSCQPRQMEHCKSNILPTWGGISKQKPEKMSCISVSNDQYWYKLKWYEVRKWFLSTVTANSCQHSINPSTLILRLCIYIVFNLVKVYRN